MALDLKKLPRETHQWLNSRASNRGTSIEMEAADVLDKAVHERMSRERIFEEAAKARVKISGPPLTAEEIECAIQWGRE